MAFSRSTLRSVNHADIGQGSALSQTRHDQRIPRSVARIGMDEMRSLENLHAAAREFDQLDGEKIIQLVDCVIETCEGMESRLAMLDSWLESRGLPADWTGELDTWGWIIGAWRQPSKLTIDRIDYSTHDLSYSLPHVVIRWDHATPEQRTEALRIEAERVKSAQPKQRAIATE